MSNLSIKIFKNTFWQVLSRIIQAFVGLISIKLISSFLPLNVYGQYTTLFEIIGFFAIIADFGLYTIGVQEMSKEKHSESFVLSHILSLRLILITILLGSSNIIIPLIPKYAGTLVDKGIGLVSLTTAFVLINGTLTSVLQYKMKMHLAAIAQIFGKIINISLIAFIILILKPVNIETSFNLLIQSAVVANLLMLLLTFILIKKETNLKYAFDLKYAKELIKTAFPYGIALILMTFYFKIDIILIQYLKGNEQAGIYGVSLKLMEILSVISVFFMNSTLPSMTKKFQQGKKDFNELIQKVFTVLHSLAAPIMVGGIILAFPIIFAITSPQFLSGYHCSNNTQIVYQTKEVAADKCSKIKEHPSFKMENQKDSYFYRNGSDQAFKIILIGLYFSFLNTIFAFSLVSINKNTNLMKINFLGFLLNIFLNLLLIPKYGFIAAAITTAVCEFSVFILTYKNFQKFTKFKINSNKYIKTIIAAIAMGVIVNFSQIISYNWMQNFNLIILIPIGFVVYFYMLNKLKVLSLKDIKKIRNEN